MNATEIKIKAIETLLEKAYGMQVRFNVALAAIAITGFSACLFYGDNSIVAGSVLAGVSATLSFVAWFLWTPISETRQEILKVSESVYRDIKYLCENLLTAIYKDQPNLVGMMQTFNDLVTLSNRLPFGIGDNDHGHMVDGIVARVPAFTAGQIMDLYNSRTDEDRGRIKFWCEMAAMKDSKTIDILIDFNTLKSAYWMICQQERGSDNA
jgi:hypothetical protein